MTMTTPTLLLGEPLAVERSARFGWKTLSILYLLIVGLGIAVLLRSSNRPDDSATSLGATLPQFRGVTTAARGVQNKMNGIGASPMQELAVAAIEASSRCSTGRDVSANAIDLRNAFSGLDLGSKKKVVKAGLQVEEMAGVIEPTGFFDPLAFTANLPEGKLRFYREVELKHGRVCMLAALGILVGENYHPLFGGDIDVPAYQAFQQTPLETFWPAVVFAIAIPEIFSVYTFNEPFNYFKGDVNGLWSIKSDHVAGDLGFDPLGLKPKDAAELKEMQTKELNNGRLAMIGAAGMIAQELVTGQKIF